MDATEVKSARFNCGFSDFKSTTYTAWLSRRLTLFNDKNVTFLYNVVINILKKCRVVNYKKILKAILLLAIEDSAQEDSAQ